MGNSSRACTAIVLTSVALGPLALGYYVARMPAIWLWSPAFWGWAFLAGWFLVGYCLGRRGYGLAGLMAGILPSLIGAGLFIQQFYLTSGEQRSQVLSLWGQLCPMIAVSPSSWLLSLLRTLGVTSLDSRVALLAAFGMVVGVFTGGFLHGRKN